jgi:hypothetical protein
MEVDENQANATITSTLAVIPSMHAPPQIGGSRSTNTITQLRTSRRYPSPAATILNEGVLVRNNLYGYTRYQSSFTINEIPSGVHPLSWLRSAIDQVFGHLKDTTPPNCHVGIKIHSSCGPETFAFLSWRKKNQIDLDLLLTNIEIKMQSNEDFFKEGCALTMTYDYIIDPKGTGYLKPNGMTAEESALRKKSITKVKNSDNLCLPRCMVVVASHDELLSQTNNMTKYKYNCIRQGRGVQLDLAEELCKNADVHIGKDGGGIQELIKFQKYFKNKYRIRVYHADTFHKTLFFKGEADFGVTKCMNLLFDGRHYYAVTSISGYFGCRRFCDECNKRFYTISEYNFHQCSEKCKSCKFSKHFTNRREKEIKCEHCLRIFYGNACFENHNKKYMTKINIRYAIS